MDLAHLTPVVHCGLTFTRFAGPWSGFTDFSKTRDLIRACPPKRVAHHWSVRCLYSRKSSKGLDITHRSMGKEIISPGTFPNSGIGGVPSYGTYTGTRQQQ